MTGSRRHGAEGGRRHGADRGSAALELVVLAPVIVALLGLVIAAGRTTNAQSAVEAAARDASRQASLAPDYAAAQADGQASALAALNSDGLACDSATVDVHAEAFLDTSAGQPGLVWATVSCTVPLSDLWLPGLPGTRTLSATFYSPLDIYRAR
jgi:Flp pilus assembly protein TadG